MNNLKDRCENCKFWRQSEFSTDAADFDFDVGICVRFPPIISMEEGLEYEIEEGTFGKEALFPTTKSNVWCGEHQPSLKPIPNVKELI